jgi:flagellar basal body-associated protein FliL
MSKKMKILIAVLVAILTLTVSGAMAVLAQEGEEPELDEEELIEETNEPMPGLRMFAAALASDKILSRVSDILGVSEEELSDAFMQAKQEMMDERCEEAFYEFLDRAVAEELLTEGEAQDIKEWWEQKPEALNSALLQKAFFMMRPCPEPLANNGWKEFKGIKRNIQQRLGNCAEPELRLEMLEKAIEEGLISEGEAAEIKAWTGNKPASLSQLSPKPRIMNEVRGRHMIAVRKGWHGPLPYQNTD